MIKLTAKCYEEGFNDAVALLIEAFDGLHQISTKESLTFEEIKTLLESVKEEI